MSNPLASAEARQACNCLIEIDSDGERITHHEPDCPELKIQQMWIKHEEQIDKWSARAEAAESLNRELVEALRELLRESVVLSEKYLEAFRNESNEKVIQGWDKARWKRALAASKRAEAAINSATPKQGEGKA